MKNRNNISGIIWLCSALLAMAGGCKLPEQSVKYATVKLPAYYKAAADSGSAAQFTFDSFFADPALVAIIDTALHNNADLLIALQRVEAARANVLLHRGALYPNLDLGISASGNRYGKYTMEGVGNSESPSIPGPFTPSYFAGVSSSWELDVWGKLRNKKKAAQMRLLASDAGRKFLATNLIADVAYHYYTLSALDEELEIIRKNIKLQETALEIVKLQKEGGRATELAVKQFAAQLAHTQGMEYRVKMDIATAENELNFLLGRYSEPIVRTKLAEATVARGVATGIPSGLLRTRPDIVQAEMEMKASAAEVASARAAFLPSFTIAGTAGFNSFSTGMLFDPASLAYGLIGGVTAPVFNKNQIRANYATMLAEHRGSQLQYGKTVMNAVFEVVTALENIENLTSEYAYNQKSAGTLNDAVKIANELFLAGYANYLEIITAQKNAIDADMEVVQTKKKLLFSNVNLYRSLGGI
jgi:NodT family efflux transporter outer membrane factor (OMF) lipoprotein